MKKQIVMLVLAVLCSTSAMAQTVVVDEEIFLVVAENAPEFPGGSDSLCAYIARNIKYPETAKKEKIEGRVFVTFVIEKDGQVSSAKILRDIGGGCGEEAIRVVKSMPKWKPGTQRGNPVRVQFNLPVSFELERDVVVEDDEIFLVVENEPEFSGGKDSLYAYIARNIVYPEAAKKEKIEGQVYVSFIVEKNGQVSSVKLLRDIGGGCGEEAIRVVKSMPKWKPGTQRGKPVRVQYHIPLHFIL